ncbi:MAG: nucleotide exchange factor GrpE [Gemmatimonadota bacterium]
MTDNDSSRDPLAGESATRAGPLEVPGENRTVEASLVDELQRAVDEQRDKYLRLAAEYDNFRKRSIRERQEAGWRAQADLTAGLIDALDDVMRFAHVDPATTDSDTLVQGVSMVEKKLLKSLAGHGLEVLSPVDQPFNPEHHEAVSTEPTSAPEEDHMVSRVFQSGYLFRGQLLRPARVVVRQLEG